ncbi:alpha/beta hydrolase-fold protein [Actinoplanes sichuanensis]|uniref:Alpha/beta hydrolase n=1 Tax=Actinoplanes sichuanensis TaxID=512349 RepID=A0ABW4AT53_9ACTN|nr:alpha/beta hydrolase-fold protein [Actinoplanes sichuanensis]BEL07189.1 alpha/beta hydrolase-fold protein [Actinoplanes sichuanensis]
MSIDSAATITLAVLLVLALTAGLALSWDRLRIVWRALLAFAVVMSLAGTAALQLNRLTEAYPSWDSLAGATPDGPGLDEPDLDETVPPESHDSEPGQGRLVTYQVPGPASGMHMPMLVYLPAAYFDPAQQTVAFPVIEALHGYPGTPETWARRLDIAGHLDREIAAGRMAPTVVLLPYQTPDRLLDTECLDLTDGPKAETYVTRDVPAWALSHLRVRGEREAWGLIGYSAGAYCAMNLALKHPDRYSAAAALSGLAGPGIKVGDQSENTTNDIAWRLRHLPAPDVALWIGWAADEKNARLGSQQVVEAARPPLTVETAVVAHGGHSHATWRQMEAPALDWLSARLARPAVPVGTAGR